MSAYYIERLISYKLVAISLSCVWCSHETLHEAKELLLINHTIAICINLIEESVANVLVKRFFVADLG